MSKYSLKDGDYVIYGTTYIYCSKVGHFTDQCVRHDRGLLGLDLFWRFQSNPWVKIESNSCSYMLQSDINRIIRVMTKEEYFVEFAEFLI